MQLFNLLGQGATAFSAQLVAQLTEDEWVWKGGSREHSGVIYNFGELEPPAEALPPTQDEVPPYLIGIVCALAGCVALMLCLRCQSVGWLVPPLSRIAASHGEQRVVVVAHGGALSMAFAELLDGDYTRWKRVMDNCAVSELVLHPTPALPCFNQVDHLRDV